MGGIKHRIAAKLAHWKRSSGLQLGIPLRQRPELAEAIESRLKGLGGTPISNLPSSRLIEIDDNGHKNWLILCGNERRFRTRLVLFPGARDNIVVIGNSADVPREIRFEKSGNLAVVGDGVRWCVVKMRFISDHGTISLGRDSIFNGTEIVVEGEKCTVEIGEDSLFAPGTTIRSSDLHGIYEIESGEWINRPASVKIEPHVWLGQDVLVLKGSRIGGGSVIAARSVVTGEVPRYTISVGAPARPIRTGICWSLEREPQPEHHEAIKIRISNSMYGQENPYGSGVNKRA